MKKTSIRKLMLKRQTLRKLDESSLDGVAGGAPSQLSCRSVCECNVTQRCSLSGCPGCNTYNNCTLQEPCR
jgi:hypothetical protein